MTDRRIARTVASNLSGLDERMRTLERLIGGGLQREIQEDAITGIGNTSSSSYTDLSDEIGPQVDVTVSRLGIIQALVSATPWPTADTSTSDIEEARITLELTGANQITADNFAATYGFLNLLIDMSGFGAGLAITLIASVHRTFLISGLAPGLTTVTMKYQRTQGSGVINVNNRHLLVVPF